MAKQSITIGSIFGIIGVFALLFWAIGFFHNFSKDPLNPENAGIVAERMVDETIPPQVNIMVKLAPYGFGGAILIILLIVFWDKVMNTKIPLN